MGAIFRRPKIHYAWPYIGIPFRPVCATYEFFEFESLPSVETDMFDHIQTLNDVQKHKNFIELSLESPTCCIVDVDDKSGMFYRDQSRCLIWRYSDKIGIYCGSAGTRTVVALTLPEFFSRVYMENSLWNKTIKLWLELSKNKTELNDKISADELNNCFRGDENGTIITVSKEKVWNVLEAVMPEEELAYLRTYYNAYGTRTSFGAPLSCVKQPISESNTESKRLDPTIDQMTAVVSVLCQALNCDDLAWDAVHVYSFGRPSDGEDQVVCGAIVDHPVVCTVCKRLHKQNKKIQWRISTKGVTIVCGIKEGDMWTPLFANEIGAIKTLLPSANVRL